MKFAEIKNLETGELRKKLDQLNHKLFDSKMKLSMKRLPNPLEIRQLRKDRARIQTILSQKNKVTKATVKQKEI